MKKLKNYSIALSATALAILMFANAISPKNKVLKENAAALAQDGSYGCCPYEGGICILSVGGQTYGPHDDKAPCMIYINEEVWP